MFTLTRSGRSQFHKFLMHMMELLMSQDSLTTDNSSYLGLKTDSLKYLEFEQIKALILINFKKGI
jgi:hypothetical protein